MAQHMKSYVRFEVFTAVTVKNVIFWDIMSCGSYKNQHFGGMFHLHDQDGGDMFLQSVTSYKCRMASHPRREHSSYKILFIQVNFMCACTDSRYRTLGNVAIRSSETLILTRATWHHIPEEGILHSHHHENFKSYICLSMFRQQTI
jgi:hypothetical protein